MLLLLDENLKGRGSNLNAAAGTVRNVSGVAWLTLAPSYCLPIYMEIVVAHACDGRFMLQALVIKLNR